MNSNHVNGKLSICDSETSLDYYVTTVNQPPLVPSDGDHNDDQTQQESVYISIDEAGIVKLRKRKKSKRRKKKSNLVMDESRLRASDDGVIYQSSGSDGSCRKVPKRSSSLCDRYLRKNSTSESFNKILSEYKRRNGRKQPDFFSKHSFEEVERIGSKCNHTKHEDSDQDQQEYTKLKSRIYSRVETVSTVSSKGSLKTNDVCKEKDSSKFYKSIAPNGNIFHKSKINRNDALATLSAFMQEVEEATNVAKQQEGERNKDIPCHGTKDETNPKVGARERKREFYQLNSRELKFHGAKRDNQILPHIPEVKHISSDDKSKSLSMSKKKLPIDSNKIKSASSDNNTKSNPTAITDVLIGTDYGLAHLEQVCKLLEQIGNLKRQNHTLTRRVVQLEDDIERLKLEKGVIPADTSYADSNQTLTFPKRSRGVGRLKEAITKSSRKSSLDKLNDSKRSDLASSFSLSVSSNYSPNLNRKSPFQSSINLSAKHNMLRRYSHDDIELASKREKWRFWKPASTTVDRNLGIRLPSMKYETPHVRGTIPIQKAYLAVDSMLGNADDEVKSLSSHWQSDSKHSRNSSKTSEPNSLSRSGSAVGKSLYSKEGLRIHLHRSVGDGLSVSHKESLRQKLSKLERAAVKRFSLENFKRTNSVDRVNPIETFEDPNSTEQNWVSNDLYKSMPCMLTVSDENSFDVDQKSPAASPEWDGLQDAFPTKQKAIKNINKLPTVIKSRWTSPLRMKNNKRKTWSFAKRKPNYFLPVGESSIGVNLEQAESICEQLTLDLNDDEVKRMTGPVTDSDELNYIKKNTQDVRRKFDEMDKHLKSPPSSQSQDWERPSSSLAGYIPTGGAVRSSPVSSRRDGIPRPSSCDLLSTYW